MSELSVTIKYDKGHDATWAVFRGSPDEIRSDIASYFGFQREAIAELTLSELVVHATDLAHGKGNAARFLGGVVLPSQSAVAETEAAKTAASNEDPWAVAGSPQAQSAWANPAAAQQAPASEPKADDPNAWIMGEIESQTTVDGLKRLWASNQSFFADASVMAAWKAKGKALSAK
ncbi:hypothetical protein SEA_DANZINA_33 [Streptomyces phage Danzina]|uniref:Uncharacterized protein n=3 Tax=Likavirus TaxID=1982880 RepID=A0A291AVP1_9CAUD|nr:hypothetical protein M183_gp33 [Streptomyces phage Zemlya]YP_009592398.1 hypothetical protein FDG70_gp33 [Streptomyces phage Danzina]ATE85060.1 hypothetical protein SEA_CELESTE_32 [Streptomyces phage Celeste]ATE85137.1 hypothetical protein SEA_DATTRAN_33 [Streptomyces phage Dattran]AGM12208.1 hypothetical protein ZEMLYA_33 [Streptomyces phage Zemlya]AKY03488.1 hypothetical protein SEA_DANZINA_33 [Streptomyces phage Danzina]